MTHSSEFAALMAQYRDTAAGLGHDHLIARRLWLLVEATAPESFHKLMHDMAMEMELLPNAYGYDDDGQRLYSFDDIAAHFGKSREEVEADMAQLIAERRVLGLPADELVTEGRVVHRVH